MMPQKNLQPKPIQVPLKIKKIFDPHPVFGENIRLDTEAETSVDSEEVRVRALNGFIIMKDGKPVYPRYSLSTAAWWKGVEVYGYIAGLTGNYRWFIWAGQWNEEYEEKHVEVVKLQNIQGMVKEKSEHWRGGQEEILWLETKAGFSYALLEPADEYNLGDWVAVTNTWTLLPDGESQVDPCFVVTSRDEAMPSWWKGKGSKGAWNHFIKPVLDAQRREKNDKRKKLKVQEQQKARAREAMEKAVSTKTPPKGKVKAGPKGKEKGRAPEVMEDEDESEDEGEDDEDDEIEGGKGEEEGSVEEPTKKKVGNSGSSASHKRKRDGEKKLGVSLRPRPKRPSCADIDSGHDTGDSVDAEDEENAKEEPTDIRQSKRLRAPSSPKKANSAGASFKRLRQVETKRKAKQAFNVSGEDQVQSGAGSNTEDQSQTAEADQSGASQPTRAMVSLTIEESTDQPMTDAVMAGALPAPPLPPTASDAILDDISAEAASSKAPPSAAPTPALSSVPAISAPVSTPASAPTGSFTLPLGKAPAPPSAPSPVPSTVATPALEANTPTPALTLGPAAAPGPLVAPSAPVASSASTPASVSPPAPPPPASAGLPTATQAAAPVATSALGIPSAEAIEDFDMDNMSSVRYAQLRG